MTDGGMLLMEYWRAAWVWAQAAKAMAMRVTPRSSFLGPFVMDL